MISFSQILEAFWFLHDPTTLNRQGNDVGHNIAQLFLPLRKTKEEAIISMEKSEKSGQWNGKYVTEIVPFENFGAQKLTTKIIMT